MRWCVNRATVCAGKANLTRSTIIAGLNGVDTPTLQDCIDALSQIADGQHFTISMRHVIGAVTFRVHTATVL